MQQNSAQVFSNNWLLYQKIVDHDYMHHHSIAECTWDIFNTKHVKPIDLLDIGCGDAAPLVPILEISNMDSYTGYDLSDAALDLAKANMQKFKFPAIFKQGNMLSLLETEENTFDLIHSSFAIHHLQDSDKMNLLDTCFKRLMPHGKMIYTDVFRKPGTSRAEYLTDYLNYINSWSRFSKAEIQPIVDHILQFDFPADISESIAGLKKIGFEVFIRLKFEEMHYLIELKKN